MKFWIPILILVLLPLQLSWATVGTYMQHDSGFLNHRVANHIHDNVVYISSDEVLIAGTDTTITSTSSSKLDTNTRVVLASNLVNDDVTNAIDGHFFDCDSTSIFTLFTAKCFSLSPISRPIVAIFLAKPASLHSLQPERPNWFVLA